jgi:uncharacterized protein (TIGR02145 family)
MSKFSAFLISAFYVVLTIIMHGCTEENAVPALATVSVTDITYTNAKSGGEITDDGGSSVIAKGVCWSTSEKPTSADHFTSDGEGSGSYVSAMEGLTGGTTYYVRAYATNSEGTAYGDQHSFTTISFEAAELTTSIITDITTKSASSGGNVGSDGGSAITERGVCWNTSENPTIADSKTSSGTGTGTFTCNISGLTDGETYYVRAYATNNTGTAYGNQVSFTTLPIVLPTISTVPISELTSTNAVSGGNTSNNGGGIITANGVCWSTSQNPTIANNVTSEGTGTEIFSSTLTGLSNGTVYYLRAYATNSAGTAYGNEICFITPVTDIEGNLYNTVKIGNQIWMAENLKVEKLKNNTPIPIVSDNTAWISLSTPGLCWFENNVAHKSIFGAIYNWFAVESGNLCPAGWHVPSDTEYNTLEISLGMSPSEVDVWGFRGTDQGTQLKSTVTWNAGGNGSNSSGFNAKAGGYRQWTEGSFPGFGVITYYWSSSDDAANGHPTVAWYRRLDDSESRVYKGTTEKEGGKSVRCVKD